MKDRCDNRMNPQFADYGGRGITYCERWKKFENFLEDMGRKPGPGFSIERKANNDNYEFSNCVWATRGEQNNNTRRNRRLAHNGTVMTVAQRAEETGIKYTTIQSRLRAGWSVSRILTTSVRKTKRKN
jgi:hypothetical protein